VRTEEEDVDIAKSEKPVTNTGVQGDTTDTVTPTDDGGEEVEEVEVQESYKAPAVLSESATFCGFRALSLELSKCSAEPSGPGSFSTGVEGTATALTAVVVVSSIPTTSSVVSCIGTIDSKLCSLPVVACSVILLVEFPRLTFR
jgi:hypothetical protein